MPKLIQEFISKINGLEKDIKQFKQVAEEFDKTQNFLESIYDGTNIAICVIDVQNDKFKFAGLNPCHEKLTGIKSNWIKGRDIDDLYPTISKEVCTNIRNKFRECIQEGKPIQFEETFPGNSKAIHWQTTLTPIKNKNNKTYRIIGCSQEISLIKEQQKILKQKNEEIAAQNEEFEALNEELRALNESLEKKVQDRTCELDKRIKEINTLYEISSLSENLTYTLNELLQSVVGLIPNAFHRPDITYARITKGKYKFQTANYKSTRWNIKHEISIQGKKIGTLVIGYTEKGSPNDDPLFLNSEKDLIAAIAKQIGNIIARKSAEIELKDKNEEYHSLYEEYLTQNEELKASNDELRERSQELEFQHRQFLTIYKNHPEIVYISDPVTYEVLLVNDNFKKMLPEDPTGKKCYEQFQGLDSPCDFCTNNIISETREPYQWEYYNEMLEKHFYIIDQLIPWPDGRKVRFELATDVTASRRNEQLLRESEEKFRRLAENAEDMIYRMSLPDGKYEYVSPASKKIFGYTPEEFYENPSLISQIIHPDWHQYFEQAWKDLLGGIVPKQYEYQAINKKRQTKWINQRNVAIHNLKGELIAIEGIVTDITIQKQIELELKNKNQEYHSLYEEYLAQNEELKSSNDELKEKNEEFEAINEELQEEIENRKEKQAELHLKNIVFNSSIAANSIADIAGNITHTNEAFLKIWGYENQKEAHGVSVSSFFANPNEATPVLEALNTNGKWQGEFLAQRKNGTHFITRGFATLVKNEKGETIGYQSANIDVTKEAKAEQKIKELNVSLEQNVLERTAELENAIKELESFSYSVSHDLRAPLRAINGYAGILKEEYSKILDEEGNEYLEVITDNTKKMGHLIDDILEFSRLSRKEIQMQKLDMNALFRQAYQELSKETEDRIINFNITKKMDKISGDQTMIKLVITNLISNAIKYSKNSNPAEITVGSTRDDNGHTYFVKDNGVGFNQKYAKKMFGVFQRLHTEKEFEGTGVGLAIAQRIINKHGGKIWAEGKLDQGATFYFYIPNKIN